MHTYIKELNQIGEAINKIICAAIQTALKTCREKKKKHADTTSPVSNWSVWNAKKEQLSPFKDNSFKELLSFPESPQWQILWGRRRSGGDGELGQHQRRCKYSCSSGLRCWDRDGGSHPADWQCSYSDVWPAGPKSYHNSRHQSRYRKFFGRRQNLRIF